MANKKKKKIVLFNEIQITDPFDESLIRDLIKIGGETAYKTFWDDVEFVHTGSLKLDRVFGGGFPMGRMIQIAGKQKSGKTTLAFIMAVAMLSAGKRVLWVDMEKKFMKSYAERMGIYVDGPKKNTSLIQPMHVEDSFDMINAYMNRGATDFIIYDSVAGSNPEAEYNSDAGDNHMMKRARLWAWFAPLMATKLEIRNAGMVLLNQYVDMTDYERIYPGGRRKDHHCSIQLDLNKPDGIFRTDKDNTRTSVSNPTFEHYGKSGIVISGVVAKNHVGTEGMRIELEVRFRPKLVIDKGNEITKLGREFGIFTKEDGSLLKTSSGFHWYDGKKLGKGDEVLHSLVEHKIVDEVVETIRKAIEMEKVG